MKMIGLQTILRARYTRVGLAAGLIAAGTYGFSPYVLNDVSTRAAINAPIIRLMASTDGTVADLPEDGQYFARQTLISLLELSDDTGDVADIKTQAKLAQATIDLSGRQLAELSSKDDALKTRAQIFADATTRRLSDDNNAAHASLQGCQAERTEIGASLERAQKLEAQGFMSPAGLEKAQSAIAMKDGECRSIDAKIRSLATAEWAAQRRVFLGDNSNDAPYSMQQTDRLLLEKQRLEKTLSDASAAYAQAMVRLREAKDRSHYRTPAGTLVWATTASSGAAIRAGQPIMDLLDCRRRFLQVTLPERKAEVVHPGDPADIRLIGSSAWLKGHVINITGAAGRRQDELLAASTYSQPGAREIMVDVALPVPDLSRFDASRKCDVGRLAEVRFSRTL